MIEMEMSTALVCPCISQIVAVFQTFYVTKISIPNQYTDYVFAQFQHVIKNFSFTGPPLRAIKIAEINQQFTLC
jgi:hypothetical protein